MIAPGAFRRLLALTLGGAVLLSVAPACADGVDQSEVLGASDRLERILFSGPPEEYVDEVQRLATECAIYNGLQGWTVADTAGLVGVEAIESGAEAHPSGLTGRALLAEQGSGLIYNLIEGRDRPQPSPVPPTAVDAHALGVLFEGPVSTPDEGLSATGGCVAWAQQLADVQFDMGEARQLERLYAEELDRFLQNAPEYVALEAEWARCMAESGFPGLEARGDQVALIVEERNRLLSGTTTDDAALTFDREISLAAWDCSELNEPDRLRVRDQFAADFAAEHGL